MNFLRTASSDNRWYISACISFKSSQYFCDNFSMNQSIRYSLHGGGSSTNIGCGMFCIAFYNNTAAQGSNNGASLSLKALSIFVTIFIKIQVLNSTLVVEVIQMWVMLLVLFILMYIQVIQLLVGIVVPVYHLKTVFL